MKIIIIGNGYDLNLKLKSGFGDFYTTYFKTKESKWDYEKIRNNIWSLLLYFKYIDSSSDGLIKFEKDSPKWMDVEGFVCEILNHNRIPSVINDSLQDKEFDLQPFGVIGCGSFESQLSEIRSLAQMKKKDFGVTSVYELFFNDLQLFESYFMNYLDSLNMPDYAVKSDLLMGKITNDFQNTYVISFNYTKLPKGLKGTNQVHGNIEERNIIIGVDKSTIKNGNINKMRFSKSWRQLSGVINNSMLPPKTDVTEIVVFGHSLGDQDYSYFHSLFNFYDLYSSNVKLTFLYADYHFDPKTKVPDIIKNEEHRINYVDSIYKLLNNYVEKSLGQKEADSFVTKIQLEGRLLVEEINEYWVNNK